MKEPTKKSKGNRAGLSRPDDDVSEPNVFTIYISPKGVYKTIARNV